MVQRTGVDPEAAERFVLVMAADLVKGSIHQNSPSAPANACGCQAKVGQFRLARLAEVELQKSSGLSILFEDVQLHTGMMQDAHELRIAKRQAAEPEPGRADGTEERAIVRGILPRLWPHREAHGNLRLSMWR